MLVDSSWAGESGESVFGVRPCPSACTAPVSRWSMPTHCALIQLIGEAKGQTFRRCLFKGKVFQTNAAIWRAPAFLILFFVCVFFFFFLETYPCFAGPVLRKGCHNPKRRRPAVPSRPNTLCASHALPPPRAMSWLSCSKLPF